jgi:glycine betaine/choline ABC-type transport system substrate-binding protein
VNTFFKFNNRKKAKITLFAAMISTLLFVISGCGVHDEKASGSSKTDTIVIATKGFAESDILANIQKLLIENDTDLKTEVKKLDNKLLWDAIKAGKADTYVEYTGTALLNLLKEDPIFDADQVYEVVSKGLHEKYQLKLLEPIGFNNTYGLAVKKETADKLGIISISDLAKVSDQLVFGASQEYINRPDSWPIIEKTYGLKYKEIKTIQEPSLQYQAVNQNLIDSMIVYSTDSKISETGLTVLKDDQNVFLPYYAAPLIRESVLKEHPELEKTLNKLAGKITDEEMQKLNGEVELNQRPPLDVAEEWLKEQGLIK